MKRIYGFTLGILFCAATAFAADQTWTGQISDSTCGASHKSAIEHSGKKLSDAECTVACVKDGGKYVFVSGGKIYDIANQDLGDLEKHAGHTVKLTGEMKDNTITVHKVEMSGKS
ncbi:MAG: hypothetical protein WEB59_06160 [Thermoanaerobaculia bacterium]